MLSELAPLLLLFWTTLTARQLEILKMEYVTVKGMHMNRWMMLPLLVFPIFFSAFSQFPVLFMLWTSKSLKNAALNELTWKKWPFDNCNNCPCIVQSIKMDMVLLQESIIARRLATSEPCLLYMSTIHVCCTCLLYMSAVHVCCTCLLYMSAIHVCYTCLLYMSAVHVCYTCLLYMSAVHVCCTCLL